MPPGEVRGRPGSSGPPILGTELRIDERGPHLRARPTVAPGLAGKDGWLVPATSGASTRRAICTSPVAPTT